MTVVVDADVLIGALDASDDYHGAARTLFGGWRERHEEIAVSVVNLTEVLVAPARDRDTLRRARAAIAALGVEIRSSTEAIAVEAARFRRRHPISLADAYCVATARQLGATVASFDAKVLRAAVAERLDVV
jgi:predicted nucleic acid-binding protein